MKKYALCVVLLLVCYALAMPTGHDVAETLSTTESLQKAETPNKPALAQEPSLGILAGHLYLPPTPAARDYRSVEAVHQDKETPSPTFPNAQDSELADDILDGKKAVVEVDFFRSPDNDNDEGARKQHSAGGITSGDKPESTSATAVTEPQSKFSENTESSSQNPEDKNVSGEQRDVRSFDSNNHNVHDEDTKEDEEDDMSVAETIIFRPLFSYRQDTAARRRYFREVSRNQPGFDYY